MLQHQKFERNITAITMSRRYSAPNVVSLDQLKEFGNIS
jgi:hypothetical protein